MQNLSETKNSYESAILNNLRLEVEKRTADLDNLKSAHEKTVQNAPYSVNLSNDGTIEVSVLENGEVARVEIRQNMDDAEALLDSLDVSKKKAVLKSEAKIKILEHDLNLLKSVLDNKDFSFSLSFSKGDMVADFTSSDFARTKLLNSLSHELLKTESEDSESGDAIDFGSIEYSVVAEVPEVELPQEPTVEESVSENDGLSMFFGSDDISESEVSDETKLTDVSAEAEETNFNDILGLGESQEAVDEVPVSDVKTEEVANDVIPTEETSEYDLFGFGNATEENSDIQAESETESDVVSEEPTDSSSVDDILFGVSEPEVDNTEEIHELITETEDVEETSGGISDFFHSTESEAETPNGSVVENVTSEAVIDSTEDLLFGPSETERSDIEDESSVLPESAETEDDIFDFLGKPTEESEVHSVAEKVSEETPETFSAEESDEGDDPLAFLELDSSEVEKNDVITSSVSENQGNDDPSDPLDFFEPNESNVPPTVSEEKFEESVGSAVAEKTVGRTSFSHHSVYETKPVLTEPAEEPETEISEPIDAEPTEEFDVLAELESAATNANDNQGFVRSEILRPELQGKSREEIENERIAAEFLKYVKTIIVKFPPNTEFTVRKEGYLDKLSNREKILTVVAGVSFTTAIIALIFASYAVDGNKFDQSVVEAQFNQKITELTAQVKSLEEEKAELINVKKANEEKEAPIAGSAKNLTINSIEKIKIDEESDPKMTTSVIKNKYLVVKLPSLKPEAGKKLSIVLKSGETIDYVIKRAISGSNDGILKIIENQEKELSSKPESQRYFVLVGTDAKQYYIAQP